jgi:hypothetical protein
MNDKTNRYTGKLEHDCDTEIFTVENWEKAINDGCFSNFDGCGYWVKDNCESNDEVFSTPKLDATHVIWYSK